MFGAKKIRKILKTKSKIHLYFRVVHSGIPLLRECSPPLTCHMSCVTRHVSRVMCHLSPVTCQKK